MASTTWMDRSIREINISSSFPFQVQTSCCNRNGSICQHIHLLLNHVGLIISKLLGGQHHNIYSGIFLHIIITTPVFLHKISLLVLVLIGIKLQSCTVWKNSDNYASQNTIFHENATLHTVKCSKFSSDVKTNAFYPHSP